jgi:hypothetical protein
MSKRLLQATGLCEKLTPHKQAKEWYYPAGVSLALMTQIWNPMSNPKVSDKEAEIAVHQMPSHLSVLKSTRP